MWKVFKSFLRGPAFEHCSNSSYVCLLEGNEPLYVFNSKGASCVTQLLWDNTSTVNITCKDLLCKDTYCSRESCWRYDPWFLFAAREARRRLKSGRRHTLLSGTGVHWGRVMAVFTSCEQTDGDPGWDVLKFLTVEIQEPKHRVFAANSTVQ